MTDDNPEIPQNPEPLQIPSISSMFDGWAKGRVEKPREIAEEVRQEANSPDVRPEIDLKATNQSFYQAIHRLGNKGDRAFRDEDISAIIHVEYGSALGDDEFYREDVAMVEVMSGTDSRERIRNLSYSGQVHPEFFRDRGKAFRIVNRYEINPKGDIKKVEEMTNDLDYLDERGLKIDDLEEIDGLFFTEYEKLDPEIRKVNGKFLGVRNELHEVTDGDYELIQSILANIKEGILPEDPNWLR